MYIKTEDEFIKKILKILKTRKEIKIDLLQIPLGVRSILEYSDGQLKSIKLIYDQENKNLDKSKFKYIKNIIQDVKCTFNGFIEGVITLDYNSMITLLKINKKKNIEKQLFDSYDSLKLNKIESSFIPDKILYLNNLKKPKSFYQPVFYQNVEKAFKVSIEDFLTEIEGFGFEIVNFSRFENKINIENTEEILKDFIKECILYNKKLKFLPNRIRLSYDIENSDGDFELLELPCEFYIDTINDIKYRILPNRMIKAYYVIGDKTSPYISIQDLIDTKYNKKCKLYVLKYPFIKNVYPVFGEISKDPIEIICPKCGKTLKGKNLKTLEETQICPLCKN